MAFPAFLKKGTIIRLNILGWYQIIGGIAGIGVTIWLLTSPQTFTWLIALLYFIAVALNCFSIYCGILSLGRLYARGLRLSMINQLLQIFSFIMMGYGYLYVAGIMLLVGLQYATGPSDHGLKLGINFSFTSSWRLLLASTETSFDVSINLVAIYLVFFVYNLQRRISAESANG